MIVSGAAPPIVDALLRVRRWMSRRVFCRFCHARSRVPMVFGPFHYCAFCERAKPDAPETIYDPRRFTGGRYRTICGASRGSASLPRLPVLTFCERAARDAPKHLRSKALHRMLLSDSLRRLARERVSLPAPAKWLGPITSTFKIPLTVTE
jgi:hypothetical protein